MSRLIALVLALLCITSVQAERFPDDAGVINVSDAFFGAVPNDGVDDTAAIQRVFDMISPSARIVYFPNGVYELSAEIFLRKSDFASEAEALPYNGWTLITESGRTFLRASDVGTSPDTAGRIRFEFDAIQAGRVLRLTHRVPGDNANSFYYRINGGPWTANTRPFNGNTNWRSDSVVATGIALQTGRNVLEIAAREAGFEIDAIALGYLANYLNNVILEGESRDGAILRLRDNARNPDQTPFNGALVRWEPGVEQFFRTAVRSLTFDVGSNNPLADGLKFHGNNQSTVNHVRFIAGPGSGDVALDLAHTDAIGPILVRDVQVDGYAVGIHSAWQNASRVFEDIRLRNQREYAWVNEAASTIWVRKLRSENAVPAFRNDSWRLPGDGQGRVALVDSELIGLPGAETQAAITTLGNTYLRNVRSSGYQSAVVNQNQQPFRGYRGQDGIDGDVVEEWWSSGAFDSEGGGMTQVFDSPDSALRLPVEESPTVPVDPFSQWDGPHRHLIEISPGVMSGRANDDIDDTLSLQAAIDSGATTVYLPNGRWVLENDVQLRGNVRRLLGTEAEMTANDPTRRANIIIGAIGPSPIVIERFANFGFSGSEPRFVHSSARTVVFNSVTGLNYRPGIASPGTVFTNDTVGNAILFQGGQKVFARQLNIEENTTLAGSELPARVVNDGAKVWILGFKTEKFGTLIETKNGGMTDLLGNLQLNDFGSSTPSYITSNAAMSAVINIKPYPESGTSYGSVRETRGTETRTGQIRGTGYSAWSNAQLWDTRGEIIVDNDDAAANLQGTWALSQGFPRGFIGNNFAFAAAGAANTARFDVALPQAGRYRIGLRWVAEWGGQDHSNHATNARLVVTHAAGQSTFTLNQKLSSDGWFTLGEFGFNAGQNALIELSGAGANGKIIVDSVRLQRLVEADYSFANGFE
jgi:hypothetical protein